MSSISNTEESTPNLGALNDALWKIREKLRSQQKILDELKAEREDLELKLMAAMDAQGTEMCKGTYATAVVSSTIMPQVLDWDAFYAYIRRNNAFYLLERRPAAVAYRELMERRRKPLPGTTSFTKRSINLRTRSDK